MMAKSFRVWAIAALLLIPVSAAAQNIDLASGGADLIWRGTEPNAASGTTLDQGDRKSVV